jgi:MPBQ/MSBQ methyltransferase
VSIEDEQNAVENYYGRGEILHTILQALRKMGKDTSKLSPIDLAPVDAFHLRGRAATVELAGLATLKPGLRVLDVGSGLGGSARYLALEYGCRVIGIDLTQEYVDTAHALADLVGLKEEVAFQQGSALDMPFDNGSFDVVWTEHVQMNIADKQAFYAEIARVLASRGRLVFHDVFQGSGGPLYYPVPWAEEQAISSLTTPEAVQYILKDLGFKILNWEDKTEQSLKWHTAVLEKLKGSGPMPLGMHLLLGDTAKIKIENLMRNLLEGRVAVIQAVTEKE